MRFKSSLHGRLEPELSATTGFGMWLDVESQGASELSEAEPRKKPTYHSFGQLENQTNPIIRSSS